jgi:hypothetical protein
LARLLEPARPCFTTRGFDTFTALLAGLITAPAHRTVCGIGTALAEARLEGRLITIGTDPNYPRRHDLQLQHALPTQHLHSTLHATTADALRALKNRSR